MNSAGPARPPAHALVSTSEALELLVGRMSRCSRIALDTEFIQGEVYKPVLALIQVALEDNSVHLIDPLALPELRGLGRIMASDRIVKVLHDPIQDLGLLHEATGRAFRNVFDTRLAGQLLSLGASASLTDYVLWLTGKKLDKGPQRSNWLARPLSESQRYYACNDVVFLLRMHSRMVEHARAIGRYLWIEEEMRRFDDPATYDWLGDPVGQVQKLDGARALRPRNQAVLLQITKWREEMAERLDIPARHLLTPGQLLRLARKAPKTPWAVRAICPEVSPFGRHIADRVKAGLAQARPSDAEMPPTPPRLTRHQRQCYRRLRDVVRSKANELDIPAMHLARKSDLEAIACRAEDTDPSCLGGWRLDIIGRDLQQVSREFYRIRFAPDAP